MYRKRSLFKRIISATFVFIFVVAHPMQVFATGNEMQLPESYEGENLFEQEEAEPLSEEEFKEEIDELSKEYEKPAANVAQKTSEFSEEHRVYYESTTYKRKISFLSVTFAGEAVGGDVSEIRYRLCAEDEFINIGDFSKEIITVPSTDVNDSTSSPESSESVSEEEAENENEFESEPESEPESGSESAPQSSDAETTKVSWSVTIPADKLEKSKLYQPEISYVFKSINEEKIRSCRG